MLILAQSTATRTHCPRVPRSILYPETVHQPAMSTTSRSASKGVPPWRRIRTGSSVASTTVDETPPGHVPPSRSPSMRPPSCSTTWAAVMQSSPPEILALVTASSPPACRIMSRAISSDGMRTATVRGSSGSVFHLRRTIVRAPGQNRSASRVAAAPGDSAICSRPSMSASRIGIALSNGRRFALNSRAIESGCAGCAATPYTVSVGNAPISPRRSKSLNSETCAARNNCVFT